MDINIISELRCKTKKRSITFQRYSPISKKYNTVVKTPTHYKADL